MLDCAVTAETRAGEQNSSRTRGAVEVRHAWIYSRIIALTSGGVSDLVNHSVKGATAVSHNGFKAEQRTICFACLYSQQYI